MNIGFFGCRLSSCDLMMHCNRDPPAPSASLHRPCILLYSSAQALSPFSSAMQRNMYKEAADEYALMQLYFILSLPVDKYI